MNYQNPYIFDRPVGFSDIFINREKELTWVINNLDNPVRLPLNVDGTPGIGRTTFLKQVQEDEALTESIGIYVNLRQLPLDSLGEFLWVFGTTVVHELSEKGLSTPPLEKRMLVLRPRQAFQNSFWRPLVTSFIGRRMLLILDNFESLASHSTSAHANHVIRQYLYELVGESQDIATITSTSGRMVTFEPMDLSPFNQSLSYHLRNFSEEQTLDLIDRIRYVRILQPAATYIYSLTRGHPADTQRLCHAVFDRIRSDNLRVITVADVVSTLRADLKPSDFRRPVHRRRLKVSYVT